MQGFQVTFFTGQSRRHGHDTVANWLMELAKTLSIPGATMRAAAEGMGRDGKVHSMHFIELADQPVEVTMVVTQEQCDALFERLQQEEANVFYTKASVEFGVLGGPHA